jgi:ubiquinone biosynthesis protein
MVSVIQQKISSLRPIEKNYAKPHKTNVGTLLRFFLNYQIRSVLKANKEDLGKWTKNELIELGPTFIKIGQFVSTRSDLFDKEIIDELSTLQDRTPAFSTDIAKSIITEDFGMPWNDIYTDFSIHPIASASISQVHRAKLVKTGEDVVVKIQRPYIREFFDRDFSTLKLLMEVGQIFQQRSFNDTKTLLDDCYQYLYNELSFQNEIENIARFQTIFKDNIEIIVPRVYPEYCTSRVITMEYIESSKINSNIPTIDKSLTATLLMESFLKQILDHGIIHADPHPGNIGIAEDGRIVLYDYGQVILLDKEFIDNVRPMLFAIFEKDVDTLITLLVKTKTILFTEETETETFTFIIQQVLRYFETVDIQEFQMSVVNRNLELDLPFKINPKIIMVFRSLSLLEGICKELDPEFSYFKVINRLMGGVFFDMDYLDHRAKKDFISLFETNTVETAKYEKLKLETDEKTKKSVKNMSENVQQYKNAMIVLFILGTWDVSNIPQSMLMGLFATGFYFLTGLPKNKK